MMHTLQSFVAGECCKELALVHGVVHGAAGERRSLDPAQHVLKSRTWTVFAVLP